MEMLTVWAVFLLRACMVSTSAIDTGTDQDYLKLISELQVQLMKLEENQKSIQIEVSQIIRGPSQHGDESNIQDRVRRDAMAMQPLPGTNEQECVPGTNGCPVSVTPFSVGGSCILCPSGPRGYPGAVGAPGRDGRDGRDAVAIVTHNGGNGMESLVPSAGTAYTGPPNNTTGAVYIRWGHSECPRSSSLIYSGSAAGSSLGSAGSGANQLCLPNDPDYDEPVAGIGTSRAFLYSIEYQVDSFPPRNDRQWQEVPCAVCKSPSRFAELMVPGKNVCPSDEWTLEYGGYLMAERSHSAHMRSMFVCVDREMQFVHRTHGSSTNRGLLDLVESRCQGTGGGLPCGPYIDGYELTCAVCTQ